jgi:four helix bundle protein
LAKSDAFASPRFIAFPDYKLYGLTSQLRRAAVSVASNIEEGQGRLTTGESKQFLGHARGSLLEIKTQTLIATELGYLDDHTQELLLCRMAETGRVLNGLIAALPTPLKAHSK